MSEFYGNIANVSKTQLQIDLIYSNRVKMDSQAQEDSVAIGRYVLIEYGKKVYPNHFYLKKSGSNLIITLDDGSAPTDIKVGDIVNIVDTYRIPDPYEKNENNWKEIKHNLTTENPGLFKVESVETEVVVTRALEDSEEYNQNYKIDNDSYGYRRGYDSTVWMKVLKDGVYAYQYVADLNTIIPTITSSVYRPTDGINIPYFDTDSTNTLYNLHVYPMPGFRIKPAENVEISDEDGLNIYFNEAGFDKTTVSKSDVENHITMTYSGISGTVYADRSQDPDIHELSIMLPGIGNAISDFWDIVYPKEGMTRLLGINGTNFYNEEQYNLNTLVGCINTAQRILGSITEVNSLPTKQEDLLAGYENGTLYKNNIDGKYYIVVKEVVADPTVAAGWKETGNYILQEIDVTDPLNTIYQMMAQLGQEVYTVDNKIGAYYGKLENAVKNIKTFKVIATENADGVSGGVTEAEVIGDTLNFISHSSQLKLAAKDPLNVDAVTFELQVADSLKDNDKLVTSSIVKTELDNINTLIGNIHTILQSINGTTQEELVFD